MKEPEEKTMNEIIIISIFCILSLIVVVLIINIVHLIWPKRIKTGKRIPVNIIIIPSSVAECFKRISDEEKEAKNNE